MTALYQIANDFAKLTDSGMEPEMIADTLDGIEWELEAKSGTDSCYLQKRICLCGSVKGRE